jgi:hypothetical protein
MYSTSSLLRFCSVSTEPLKIGSTVSPAASAILMRTAMRSEIDVYKTDLNIATLEDWKLKVLTLMRRRYPQFGALLQLAWADESNEQLLEIISDNEHAATATTCGAHRRSLRSSR